MITTIVVIVVVVLLALYLIGLYNGFVKLRNNRENAFANIDVQLKQRHDLIPQLVASVKGYATHEEEVFTKIADARGRLAGATSMQEKAEADAALTAGLGRLLAIAESYPELKANEGFLRLQDELAGTENRIKVTRKRYNQDVKSFNRTIRQFPGSLFAGNLPFIGLNLEPREYFEPPQGHDAVVNAPKVEF